MTNTIAGGLTPYHGQTGTCTDAGAALAPLLGGRTRVRTKIIARHVELPLDDRCRP